MKRTLPIVVAILAIALAAGYLVLGGAMDGEAILRASAPDFLERDLAARATFELMDIGVVDVDKDDRVDLFTANHNWQQVLWISDGKGGFGDSLTVFGLNQDPRFPGLEISEVEPKLGEPGVYIFWKGRNERSQFSLVIQTHRLAETGPVQGTLRTFSAVRRIDSAHFDLNVPQSSRGEDHVMPETTIGFATDKGATLEVEVASPDAPVTVEIAKSFPTSHVFVGTQLISPRSTDIDPVFQDRHGMAWHDLNDDGRMYVYIARGAIAGTLRLFSERVPRRVHDEILVSGPDGRYRDVIAEVGLQRRGCSGRKVAWVDYDGDGLLDLFINCQERGYVAGHYPVQLYRQQAGGRFIDVAADAGLDTGEREIIDFVWFDADGDARPDLLTYEDAGFVLYRNRATKGFSREPIGRGVLARTDNPKLRGRTDEYCFVDGRLAAEDFDGDGAIDVSCASKKGNVLLQNDGNGQFTVSDPSAKGLPRESVTAVWVDCDNDGRPDLHSVPQEPFRQRRERTFAATGPLELASKRKMAAIVNWPDVDNDGRRDGVLALLDNFFLWNWREKQYKSSADRFKREPSMFRNGASESHWLQLRLIGKPGNRLAIGARVELAGEDRGQTQVVGLNDGAFLSQGHHRLYFGLGAATSVPAIRIIWPNGESHELRNVGVDHLVVVSQGNVPS